MAGERTFLQVPPDGAGKRVRMTHTAEIFYTSKTPTDYVWGIGDFYTTTFSDDAEYTIHVHGVHQTSNTTGVLEVHYNKSAKFENLSPKTGAVIKDDDGVTVATVLSSRDIFINSNHIIGYDNPEYGVDVDPTGSMNVRFAEGLPQLDAFGKLRVSGKTILGDYTFGNDMLLSDFAQIKWGRAAGSDITQDDDLHCLTLYTPDGTATARGDERDIYTEQTSHTYHHYFPGVSQQCIMTTAAGDTGQAGVIREWGYFDDNNGYFFRMNEEETSVGGDNLELVIRSKVDGNVREIRMARNYTKEFLYNPSTFVWTETSTSTDGWNGDVIDGTGDSGKLINLTDDNIWWIDIQWLGAGRVRYGTYHRGQRIVVHQYYHDTNGGKPHSQTGSLPLSFRQYHVLNTAVINPSIMRVWCAAVSCEADIDLRGIGRGQLETISATFDPGNLNDWEGLNDTGKGDRVGVTQTGTSGSTTTLTVSSVTGIKPGYRLHMVNANGGGSLVMGTEVVEIVNSTTIIVSQAPATPLTGVESIRFYMHVQDEYHMIGILSPREELDGHTGHNGTLYIPQAMQAMAYHENGDPAFCEVEVYVNPVLSGNATALTLESTEGGPFVKIEPNDPACAVVSYKDSGLVNYFGGGYHQLASYFKGETGQEDLGAQYSNIQQGAFKNFASGGGNNRCPILRVIQSPSAGVATVIEIDVATVFANGGPDFSLHREGNGITLEGINGLIGSDATNGLNDGLVGGGAGKTYYLRMISQAHAELYEDNLFTIPADTSGISNATNGGSFTWNQPSGPGSNGWIISGYGEYLYFAIVAKPIGPSIDNGVNTYGSTDSTTNNRDITVHFRLNWNEINQ